MRMGKPLQELVICQNPDSIETVGFLRPDVRHSSAMILVILRLLSLIPIDLTQRSGLALENLELR